MKLIDLALRLGIAASLALSGVSHAYLFIHGYRYIPAIGPAFLLQASVCMSVAVLVAIGGPAWLRWVAAALSAGSLVAFALSRTVGLLGFTERGWQPAPQAAISVAAEVFAVALWATWLLSTRSAAREPERPVRIAAADPSA
jgi:hypothetical protein